MYTSFIQPKITLLAVQFNVTSATSAANGSTRCYHTFHWRFIDYKLATDFDYTTKVNKAHKRRTTHYYLASEFSLYSFEISSMNSPHQGEHIGEANEMATASPPMSPHNSHQQQQQQLHYKLYVEHFQKAFFISQIIIAFRL